MRKFNIVMAMMAVGFLLSSCEKKMDDPEVIAQLQKHIENVVNQGYKIDRINVYSKSFSDDGSGGVGYFKLLFISAASDDPSIEYLANFSYTAGHTELSFHGYPVDSRNKRTQKNYPPTPDLVNATTRLDEMKKLIPDGFKYKNLLNITYTTTDSKPVYKFDIEVKPKSDNLTHPNVRQEKKSHVEYSSTRKRRGGGRHIDKTDITREIQHIVTFYLKDDHIEIK